MQSRYSRVAGSLALAAACAVVIGACGSSEESGSADNGASANTGASTTKAAVGNRPAWCGDREITVSLSDGIGNNNWQRITRYEAEDEASKCPSVKEFIYTDGQSNTQKAISDIQGLVAQGVNAMVVFPHAGKAVLPAMRSAYKAGVTVVPYRSDPGGEPGQDYTDYISTDSRQYGELWGRWIAELLRGRGRVLYLGGPAASTLSLARLDGLKSVIGRYPGIELIGQQPYNVTNWDPAMTQQVVTAALAKYPRIDLIAADFGAALASSFSAFEQAGRRIPPVATEDSNLLGCDWARLEREGKGFPLYTNSSQTWMVRIAIQNAVAKASGGTPPDQLAVLNTTAEDSVSGKPSAPKCNPDLPQDAILSSRLTTEQLQRALQ